MRPVDDRDLARSARPTFPVSGCCLPQSGAGQGAREEARGASAGDGTSVDPHCQSGRRKPAKHDAGVIGLAVGAVIDKHKMRSTSRSILPMAG